MRFCSLGRSVRPAPDLVNQEFAANHATKVCIADITTWRGPLHRAIVLDGQSRRFVSRRAGGDPMHMPRVGTGMPELGIIGRDGCP